MAQDKVMTLEEAAAYSGYALETIKILVKRNVIPSYTPEGDELIERSPSERGPIRRTRGASVLVKASDLDAYKAQARRGRRPRR